MALIGGYIYRWRGHASQYKKYFPRPLNQIAFSLPYALACANISWWAAGVVLIITTLAVLSGHGGWFDLGTWTKPRDDETLEFIIKPLKKYLSDYWYDVLGLALSGVSITAACGIVYIAWISIPVGLCIIASGALKAVAYMMGWKLFDDSVATARGEWLTGAFLWGSLAWVI